MQTFQRICIQDWEITAKNGDHFKVERGREYLTSAVNCAPSIGPQPVEAHVVVFADFWVPVPVEVFAGAVEFTPEDAPRLPAKAAAKPMGEVTKKP